MHPQVSFLEIKGETEDFYNAQDIPTNFRNVYRETHVKNVSNILLSSLAAFLLET